MIISNYFSFNDGEKVIEKKYPHLLKEIKEIIASINAENCRLKEPKGNEVNKLKRIGEKKLYSPPHLNAVFDYLLIARGWNLKPRITTNDRNREGFREMDAIKEMLGIEIQFGKYAFLTYDIVAKMIIYKNFGVIDAGIEICPTASMLPHLSSGIGAFEQVAWDLEHRGAINGFDVPVLVIGIETDVTQKARQKTKPKKEKEYTNQISIDRVYELNKGTKKKLREAGIEIE